jgi:hypothetical protein
VKPEAVDPGVTAVGADSSAEQSEPVQDRHGRRPVPTARQEIGDEEPTRGGDDEDEQGEAKHAQGDGRRNHGRELEDEQPEAKALEPAAVRVREPAEPVQQSPEEDDEADDGRQCVDTSRDKAATSPGHDREDQDAGEDDRREAGECRRRVLARLGRKQRQHRDQGREAAEVDQKGSARPRHANRVHPGEG